MRRWLERRRARSSPRIDVTAADALAELRRVTYEVYERNLVWKAFAWAPAYPPTFAPARDHIIGQLAALFPAAVTRATSAATCPWRELRDRLGRPDPVPGQPDLRRLADARRGRGVHAAAREVTGIATASDDFRRARWYTVRPAANRKPATYTCPLCRRQLPALSQHMLVLPDGDGGAAPSRAHRMRDEGPSGGPAAAARGGRAAAPGVAGTAAGPRLTSSAAAERMRRMRDFDPRLVGRLECAAWIAYYRREWLAFLRAAIRLTRHTFGLPWPATLYGSWLVLRANQLWAPYPDNDPEGARRCMRRFYSLLVRRHHERFDVDEAARLEVEWWRVHRIRQREQPGRRRGSTRRRADRAVRPRLSRRARGGAHGRTRADPGDGSQRPLGRRGLRPRAARCSSTSARRSCARTLRCSPRFTGENADHYVAQPHREQHDQEAGDETQADGPTRVPRPP